MIEIDSASLLDTTSNIEWNGEVGVMRMYLLYYTRH